MVLLRQEKTKQQKNLQKAAMPLLVFSSSHRSRLRQPVDPELLCWFHGRSNPQTSIASTKAKNGAGLRGDRAKSCQACSLRLPE